MKIMAANNFALVIFASLCLATEINLITEDPARKENGGAQRRQNIQLPQDLCTNSKFERVLNCCQLPTILSAEDFRLCRIESEMWFQPPVRKNRPKRFSKTSPLDNPLLKACIATCVFKRNLFILETGELDLNIITAAFLRNQTSDDWKKVIPSGVNKCYNQFRSVSKDIQTPCNIENFMFLTCIRQYLVVNCPESSAAFTKTNPTCDYNLKLLQTCNPYIRDPRIEVYPPMRRRKRKTTTMAYDYYQN
ncbi:uncharacterized protein LOC132197017 [Neocloeon triangulifer]|uniref:uncharacterized protein LOC132197017 n=1 Tax=Neocloeon triangulifer TaxID=2078957 RepID=UPI00286EC6C9|nr:uncharacterized protein LOC132197017 [Neocloeon triangulifer]